jgi:hypothetical protein
MNDLKNKVRMPTRGIFYAPLFARLGYYSFQFGFLTWDKYAASLDGAQNIPPSVSRQCKETATHQTICYLKTEKEKRNNEQPTHKTAHLQAPTHKPMLQLAKEQFSCRRTHG